MIFFTIKTSDSAFVEQFNSGKVNLICSGLNSLEDRISIGSYVFLILGGDNPPWQTGFAAICETTSNPLEKGYDPEKPKNYRLNIRVLLKFDTPIGRSEFSDHKDTFDTGVGPMTKGERNQALSEIERGKFLSVCKALLRIRPTVELGLPEGIKTMLHDSASTKAVNKDKYVDGFFDACKICGLKFSEQLCKRLLSSLVTKPFIILTGLSGSGKTKIAQAFVSWICNKEYREDKESKLSRAISSSEFLDNYKVSSSNSKMLSIINTKGDSGKIIPLPVDAIFEWYDAIQGVESVDPKDFKDIVGEKSKFQKYIHGFYNDFYKIASLMKRGGPVRSENRCRYKIVPVGADWSNNERLLGYANALNPTEYVMPDTGVLELMLDANDNPTKPFFLVLDEMNLSHVERYFADFLSVMESGKEIQLYMGTQRTANNRDIPHDIPWPKNLFIIGTVNVDETTYMFSPKVLDRAQVIEFRVSQDEMNAYLLNPSLEIKMDALDGKGAEYAEAFLAQAQKTGIKAPEGTVLKLNAFFGPLAEVGAEFGYRTANEFLRFVGQYMALAKDADLDVVVDFAVMQKLLPKLHGSKRKLRGPLNALWILCLKDGAPTKLMDSKGIMFNEVCKYPVSAEKISRMYFNAEGNGFTSYAEA